MHSCSQERVRSYDLNRTHMYMYREADKLMINFETYEGAVMGSRFPHLAGKKFEFDWTKIYLKEETKPAAISA